MIRESRWHLAGYVAIAGLSLVFHSWAALTFWLIPMVPTKPIHQLQNTIEHLGLSHEDDIPENTRSTRANALIRWLCWQMPYHTAHHVFPAVPFWKLRDLNGTDRGEGGRGASHGLDRVPDRVIRQADVARMKASIR